MGRALRPSQPEAVGAARALRLLRAARNKFGAPAEAEKRRLLALVVAAPPTSAKALLAAHEDLLFLRAFPGEAATLRAVNDALTHFASWAARLSREERALLADSGVAGSLTRHVYPLPVAHWLTRRAPGEAEIDWRHYENPALLDRALLRVLRPVELEAAESGEYSTRDIIKAARSVDATCDLGWIVGALSATDVDATAADADWNEAEVPVVWDLTASRFATTANFLPGAMGQKNGEKKNSFPVYRRAMRRPGADVAARIAEPAPVDLLPRARARRVIELAQSALAARCREVLPISYANPDEVYWCDLGEGAALAVIGVTPEKRLNLETNTGYILISNGAPIGYGGVTPFYRQANTGINIFDAYRGGEAAYLWVEMLRAFRAIYDVRRFVVNGYQFGEGNAEAISSGAYWFYYRLGFRPVRADLQMLAAREAKRLSRPGAAPSEKATLRALAHGDLTLDLPGFDARDALDEGVLQKASFAASRRLAAMPATSRAEAERLCVQEAAALLSIKTMADWPRAEREAFARLAPIALIAPGLADYAAAEKNAIALMMRAKGRPQERDFARAAGACERFHRDLTKALA